MLLRKKGLAHSQGGSLLIAVRPVLTLTFLLTSNLMAQAPTVVLGEFQAYRSRQDDALAANLHATLVRTLAADGFQVVSAGGPTSEALAAHPSAQFFVSGYYETGTPASLYAQIYRPDSGVIVDAFSLVDPGGTEGILLDPEEMRESSSQRIGSFARTVSLRLKTNPRRIVRWDSISEHLKATGPGRDFSFPFDSGSTASQEVFQILQGNVSVASNVITEAEKQPASVTIVSNRQIQMSGARTVNELLTMFVPGYFSVEDQDDTIAGFRGLAPDNNSKVLLLLNGHNMNTEWFSGPPDSILNGMNMEFIERIEVIRGPGSVTLGQGALLGVINIVTKNGSTSPDVGLFAAGGQDGYASGSIQAGQSGRLVPSLTAYALFQHSSYNGQRLRNEGWAHDRQYEGTDGWYDARIKAKTTSQLEIYKNVAKGGSRLKRATHETGFATIQYGGLDLDALFTDQLRDNYNFYRDRNEIRSRVLTGNASYRYEFSEYLFVKAKGFYTTDDTILQSHSGHTMGGTREERYGGSILARWDTPSKRNRLAVGGEYRRYDMGQPDINGNNFIANKADTTLLDNVNANHRYVFPRSIVVASGFAEDFFSITPALDVFGALRYDKHIFWGTNVSPRLGALYALTRNLRTRLSYQEGFRGAVGLSYAGGFQGDGLLRSDNFDKVALARIPTTDQFNNPTFFTDVPEAEPEKMRSYEAAFNYSATPRLGFEFVTFYNVIQKVIDVGVVFADPAVFKMPNVGTDQPGDWNGYFFFRNLPGVIRSGGAEAAVTYKNRLASLSLSHALTRVLAASDSLYFTPFNGGMYLTQTKANKHFRAFPENVTRLNAQVFPGDHWEFSVNYLYYANWYSPVGNRIEGNHILNTGVAYKFNPQAELSLIVKNVLAEGRLMPMNSNAGDTALSDGSPALEARTYLLAFRSRF